MGHLRSSRKPTRVGHPQARLWGCGRSWTRTPAAYKAVQMNWKAAMPLSAERTVRGQPPRPPMPPAPLQRHPPVRPLTLCTRLVIIATAAVLPSQRRWRVAEPARSLALLLRPAMLQRAMPQRTTPSHHHWWDRPHDVWGVASAGASHAPPSSAATEPHASLAAYVRSSASLRGPTCGPTCAPKLPSRMPPLLPSSPPPAPSLRSRTRPRPSPPPLLRQAPRCHQPIDVSGDLRWMVDSV